MTTTAGLLVSAMGPAVLAVTGLSFALGWLRQVLR